MAASITGGSSKKVRNSSRTKGYWVSLAASRSHRVRDLAHRDPRTGINYPLLTHVGSAAYRRL